MTHKITTTKLDYREALQAELTKRRWKNPSYSMRGFAKSLGISVTTLSQVLSAKRSLSKHSAHKIAECLFFDPRIRQQFLSSALGLQDSDVLQSQVKYKELDVDEFKLIADWYHFAILSLAKIQPNYLDAEWVAMRLGIQIREAKSALDRLQRLGLISKEGVGFVQTSAPLFVKPTQSSIAVRKYHSDNLSKAQLALEQIPREARDITSITVATSPHKMKQAKAFIQKFREDLCAFLEEDDMTEVYTLAVQFFPVTQTEMKS